MRLPAALARFEVQLQADGRSPHTVAQYARHVRRFEAWLEAEHLPDDVTALEPEHVARFLASAEALRRTDGRSKRTGSLNALRSSLRGFFAFLETSGFVALNPARVLRMTRVGTTPPKGLRPEEVAALMTTLAAGTGRSLPSCSAPAHAWGQRWRSKWGTSTWPPAQRRSTSSRAAAP